MLRPLPVPPSAKLNSSITLVRKQASIQHKEFLKKHKSEYVLEQSRDQVAGANVVNVVFSTLSWCEHEARP